LEYIIRYDNIIE